MKETVPLPSLRYLRECFEHRAGKLYWREGRPESHFTRNKTYKGYLTRCAGKEAGGEKKGSGGGRAYRQVRVANTLFFTHRIVWAMHHGDATADIDHINGNGLDNRLENLREATRQENCRNMPVRTTSKSGVPGVTHSQHKPPKWIARIKVDYKNITLGTFDKLEDAISARLNANEQYGFHANHGRSTTQ